MLLLFEPRYNTWLGFGRHFFCRGGGLWMGPEINWFLRLVRKLRLGPEFGSSSILLTTRSAPTPNNDSGPDAVPPFQAGQISKEAVFAPPGLAQNSVRAAHIYTRVISHKETLPKHQCAQHSTDRARRVRAKPPPPPRRCLPVWKTWEHGNFRSSSPSSYSHWHTRHLGCGWGVPGWGTRKEHARTAT